MKKHTPGPWRPPHFTDDAIRCNCGHIFSEHQEHMGAVCTLKWDVGFDAQKKSEAIANAHLIASAPDMYEALEKIIEMNRQQAQDMVGNADVAENWSCVTIARSALLKARGET